MGRVLSTESTPIVEDFADTVSPPLVIDRVGRRAYILDSADGVYDLGASFGYIPSFGLGGTVTQLTSKATGVTLNTLCGQITTHNASLGHYTSVTFTVTNSMVSATDVVVVNRASGGTPGAYDIRADAVTDGSFTITVRNEANAGGSLSEALVLNFAIIKSVIN